MEREKGKEGTGKREKKRERGKVENGKTDRETGKEAEGQREKERERK